MTSEQHSRILSVRSQLDAVRRELSTSPTSADEAKQTNFKDNQGHLDTAIKELDAVKVVGG